MKIQLGSGSNHLEGFQNYDAELDVTKLPLPFETDSVEFLFMEHLFEHIAPVQGLHLLDDILRILKPGGIIRLCVPVLERVSAEHGRNLIEGHGHQCAYSTQSLKDMLRIAGFQNIRQTGRATIDSHWKAIGIEKDDLESCRVEAVK